MADNHIVRLRSPRRQAGARLRWVGRLLALALLLCALPARAPAAHAGLGADSTSQLAPAELVQPGPVFTVNSSAATADGVCDDTNCTLRDAFAAANGYEGFSLTQ